MNQDAGMVLYVVLFFSIIFSFLYGAGFPNESPGSWKTGHLMRGMLFIIIFLLAIMAGVRA